MLPPLAICLLHIPHWPFCLGGMGWLCCGLGLVACQHSVGHPALSAKPWLHMSGDFCACFPRGTKSCLDHPQLSEVWCQFDCRSCCKAGQCSKISLWLISLRRLCLVLLFTPSTVGFGLIEHLPKSKEVLGTPRLVWYITSSLCAWLTWR